MRVTDSTKHVNRPFILGVAGGSGSGKTYFAKDIQKKIGRDCAMIMQDNFYFDQSKKFDFDGGSVNFDHPSSIDAGLLVSHLKVLKSGKAINIPTYDFKTHSRTSSHLLIEPKPVIIVDGILIFHWKEVRDQFDDLIFFDTEESLRYERRLRRDVEERGREAEGVKNQIIKQVKPMHDEFVEPSREYANRVVTEKDDYQELLDFYSKKLSKLC